MFQKLFDFAHLLTQYVKHSCGQNETSFARKFQRENPLRPGKLQGTRTLTYWLDLPCLRPGHVGDRVEPRSGSVGWLLRTSPGRRPDYRPPPRRSPSQPPTSPSLCSTRRQRGPAFGRAQKRCFLLSIYRGQVSELQSIEVRPVVIHLRRKAHIIPLPTLDDKLCPSSGYLPWVICARPANSPPPPPRPF